MENKLRVPLYESRYESLVSNPEHETCKLLEFLDLPWAENLLDFHSSPIAIHTPTYADVSQPIHQKAVGRWKNYEKSFVRTSPFLNRTFVLSVTIELKRAKTYC